VPRPLRAQRPRLRSPVGGAARRGHHPHRLCPARVGGGAGQWRQVADSFRPRYPKRAALLAAAQADVLAYLAFPPEHGRQIWSTNPLERLNRAVKRRTDVAGLFPNEAAMVRLV